MNIYPTILEPTLDNILSNVKIVENDFEYSQIDICDGIFIKSTTFSDILAIDQIPTTLKFEIDLMTVNPENYVLPNLTRIKKYCGHAELPESQVRNFINKCRQNNYEVGLVLNHNSSIDPVLPYIGEIDYVQFMTVVEGAQGHPFLKEVLEKITQFKDLYPDFVVQVDGGVKLETIQDLLNAGVNNAVMGSAIFGSPNPAEVISKLKEF